MSSYLQALARAAGADLEVGPDPLTAMPRPKSRFEDLPEGLAVEAEVPDFGDRSFETEAPRAAEPAPTLARPLQVQPDARTEVGALSSLPRAEPDIPAPPLRRDPGAGPSQAALAADAAPAAALVARATKVEATPGPSAPAQVANDNPPLAPAVLPHNRPSAAVTIASQPEPLAAPKETPAPPAVVVQALPTKTRPALDEVRPSASDVPQPATATNRHGAGSAQPLIIEIGRVEIRLDAPAAARPAAHSRRGDDRPVLSLADFLSDQGPGARRS